MKFRVGDWVKLKESSFVNLNAKHKNKKVRVLEIQKRRSSTDLALLSDTLTDTSAGTAYDTGHLVLISRPSKTKLGRILYK